jgi:hypothetical protein
MAVSVITLERAVEIISAQGGRIYSVVFEKKSTGLDRLMVCRNGVHAHMNGGELKFDPRTRGLINTYDMQSKGYRMINLAGLKKLKASGREYAIRR